MGSRFNFWCNLPRVDELLDSTTCNLARDDLVICIRYVFWTLVIISFFFAKHSYSYFELNRFTIFSATFVDTSPKVEMFGDLFYVFEHAEYILRQFIWFLVQSHLKLSENW